MSLTAGVLSLVKAFSNSAQMVSTPASGGTGPYTAQWYKSFTNGFSANASTLIPGATSLNFTDTQLLPATDYYYKVIFTDTGNGNATVTSAQLTTLTVAGNPVEMNQIQQTCILGQVDQPQNPNTTSVTIDSSYGGAPIVAGTAVKAVNPTGVTAGGGLNTIPHVVPVTANTDIVLGFIQYNAKFQTFGAGMNCEISKTGNVQYQMATANGNANDAMQLDVTIPGGLTSAVGSSGATICGNAIDQPVVGQLFRLAVSVQPHITA